MGIPLHEAPNLTIKLFGGFYVSRDGSPIDGFESDRVRALLAYLLVMSDRPQGREHLAGLLWPDYPEERARQNLSQALYNLRNQLDDRQTSQPYLIVKKSTLQFNAGEQTQVDIRDFEDLLSRCQAHDHTQTTDCDECVGRLDAALSLYQGEFLAGFSLSNSSAFEEWRLVRCEYFHRQAVSAARTLVGCLEEQRRLQEALELTWRWAGWDPYSETAHRKLLHLLAATGGHTRALVEHQRFRRLLGDELAIEPSQETTALYERLRRDAAALAASTAPRHNLPESLTPFVGRSAEIRDLAARLQAAECRLLTLVGPGGAGKTRLAIQTARTLLENFPHGVFFVPLGDLGSHGGILPAVGQAIGVYFQEAGSLETQTLDYLRDRRLLLILDGFETLLDGVHAIEKVLRIAPEIKILATSRVRLNTKFETWYTLSGLGVPAASAQPAAALASESVQLFLSGAMRARLEFSVGRENLRDILEICRLVQGMPLGILLASAWVALLTPDEIAARIQNNLDFLAADWQDLPERLRSLRATFNYSWDLLDEGERAALQNLSVFRGGFSLQAAEQVTDCIPNDLLRLMEKSLLQRTPEGRFEVHDLVRQYAAEKLAHKLSVELAVRERHCAYYLDLLERSEADLLGPRQAPALETLDPESENLHLAWRWAVDNNQRDRIERVVNGLGLSCDIQLRHLEAEQACRLAAEKFAETETTDEHYHVWLRLLAWQLYFTCLLTQTDSAHALWKDIQKHFAMAEIRDLDVRWEQALVWYGLGRLEQQLEKKREILQRAVSLFKELDKPWYAAIASTHLGVSLSRSGDFSLALQAHEESLRQRRRLAEPMGIADTLRHLSYYHAFQGDQEKALNSAQEAADLNRSIGTPFGEVRAAINLGVIYNWLGRFAEGCALLEEILGRLQQMGLRSDEIFVRNVISVGKMALGDYKISRSLAERSLEMAGETGFRREYAGALLILGALELVEGNYLQARDYTREGVNIYRGLRYKAELSWALGYLGLVQRCLGEGDLARGSLCAALHLIEGGGGYLALNNLLPLAALLLADRGGVETAVETWAMVTRLTTVASSRWLAQVAGQPIEALTETLSPEARLRAQQRGQKRDPLKSIPELLEIFGCDVGLKS